jgi:uncharacterized protein (DUF3084 family)
MSMDAEIKATFINYTQLVDRIKKLILIVNKLNEKNDLMQNKLRQLEKKMASHALENETLELKEELKKLKVENKILKEKETQIKTKIERLAVKLDQIQL